MLRDFNKLVGAVGTHGAPCATVLSSRRTVTQLVRTRFRAALLGLTVASSCTSFSRAAYHGPRSDHFDGRRFHNLVRIRDHQIDDAIHRELSIVLHRRGRWARWQETPTDTPPPRVGAGGLRVTFVNHATVLLQVDSLNVLVDPVWSDRVSPVGWAGPKRHRPPGIRFDDLPPIDVVLISHDHFDHMDLPTLRRLADRFHPRIVTGLGNAEYLAKRGIAGAVDVDWWQELPLGRGVTVAGVPAQHWSARSLADKWRRLWLGFVLQTPSGAVYVAGDTGYAEFFDLIRTRYGPFRLAVLPIGPQRPRKAMAPRHMSASEAVRAAERVGAATSLAVHFGTFQQGDDGQDEPVDSLRVTLAARDSAHACVPRVWAFRNGEARFIPSLDSVAPCPARARVTAPAGRGASAEETHGARAATGAR